MSKRTIITVGRHPTLHGVYRVGASGGGARPGRSDIRGAAAAAAAAMERAVMYGAGGYQVFAPEEVLAHVPDDMRSGFS